MRSRGWSGVGGQVAVAGERGALVRVDLEPAVLAPDLEERLLVVGDVVLVQVVGRGEARRACRCRSGG